MDAPFESLIKARTLAYSGRQPGDPAKLGNVLVQIAAMDAPPKQFAAGTDASTGIAADLKARLVEIAAYQSLSSSTDGDF